jgi:hypothetical protein
MRKTMLREVYWLTIFTGLILAILHLSFLNTELRRERVLFEDRIEKLESSMKICEVLIKAKTQPIIEVTYGTILPRVGDVIIKERK